MMSTILVIAGGSSPERDVSLRSGRAVVAALQASGHEVRLSDPAANQLTNDAAGCDVAFPVLHGIGGEDGQVQAVLEQLGLPYVGSGVEASQLCFNKAKYKEVIEAYGIPTPRSALVSDLDALQNSPFAEHPFVLKPFDGGSSIDTFIVRDPAAADFTRIEGAFSRNGTMLLEELIEGTEITVAVLDDKGLPVIEIIPPESGEFDYENKYNGTTQELCPPLHVPKATQATARDLAAHIHAICGCADYSRTDMIVRPSGELMVLETNTLPGMTAQSLFPKAASTAGFSMEQLCNRLVTLALVH